MRKVNELMDHSDRPRPYRGYPPMKLRQIAWTLSVLLLAMTLVGLFILLLIDRRVTFLGNRYQDTAGHGPYDCILVPGAPYNPDGTPGDMLKDRLDEAVQIWQANPSLPILISGDSGTPAYDELSVMKSYLICEGVPTKQIIEDPAGFDTYQTVIRASQVFGMRSVIVTTQQFHLVRTAYIAHKTGLAVRCVSSDHRQYAFRRYHRFREIVARSKAAAECLFKPAPLVCSRHMPEHQSIQNP